MVFFGLETLVIPFAIEVLSEIITEVDDASSTSSELHFGNSIDPVDDGTGIYASDGTRHENYSNYISGINGRTPY